MACCGVPLPVKEDTVLLRRWSLPNEMEGLDHLQALLSQLLEYEVAWFESELSVWLNDTTHIFRDLDCYNKMRHPLNEKKAIIE